MRSPAPDVYPPCVSALHLVLTEGRPVLPPSRVPDLVDRYGAFRTDIARVGASIFFNPSTRAQAASEIEAQFEAFRATGLRLDHANAHQHFHLHPTIGGLMAGIGRRYGLTAVRGPLEPPAVLAKVGPVACLSSAWLTAPFARLLCRPGCAGPACSSPIGCSACVGRGI